MGSLCFSWLCLYPIQQVKYRARRHRRWFWRNTSFTGEDMTPSEKCQQLADTRLLWVVSQASILSGGRVEQNVDLPRCATLHQFWGVVRMSISTSGQAMMNLVREQRVSDSSTLFWYQGVTRPPTLPFEECDKEGHEVDCGWMKVASGVTVEGGNRGEAFQWIFR